STEASPCSLLRDRANEPKTVLVVKAENRTARAVTGPKSAFWLLVGLAGLGVAIYQFVTTAGRRDGLLLDAVYAVAILMAFYVCRCGLTHSLAECCSGS